MGQYEEMESNERSLVVHGKKCSCEKCEFYRTEYIDMIKDDLNNEREME